VEVGVSLCGVAVPGGPWRPRAGCMAKGVHIATLKLMPQCHNDAMAVSLDGSLMVLFADLKVFVYATVDGSLVRSFGHPDTGEYFRDGSGGICMTAHNTVLVGEMLRKRIQEVTLEGKQGKHIQLEDEPYSVTAHGDLVAVLMCFSCIGLYSYTSGKQIRKILCSEVSAFKPRKICFAPDGKHLVVGVAHGYITLVSVDGQSARPIGRKGSWRGVAFTCTGNVIGVNQRGAIHVLSATDGMLLRSWTTEMEDFPFLTVRGNRLYALTDEKVQVFE